MYNLTLKSFVMFIFDMPAEKKINHFLFDTCAIGEFCLDVDRAQLPQRADGNPNFGEVYARLRADTEEANPHVSRVLLPGCETHGELSLVEALNEGGIGEKLMPTYGAMQELIRNYYPGLLYE